jgi:hypothetical protein
VDVFEEVLEARRDYFRGAAVHAALELGLDTALANPKSADSLAAQLGVPKNRLEALLDVLTLEGFVLRSGGIVRLHAVLDCSPIEPDGWGGLAACLGAGPLGIEEPEWLARHQHHLFESGRPAAAELAAEFMVSAETLLDVGGGVGGYTRAFLDRHPTASATLIDSSDVAPLARQGLADYADRVTVVEGDFLELGDFCADVVLLSNVLHLHPPEVCHGLIAKAAACSEPGGCVIVKDVFVEPDRSGPAVALYFALNMCLFTEGGSVYDADEIGRWMTAAGLGVTVGGLRSSPGSVVVVGQYGRPT